MSGYHDLLPLARIAEILGGDARRFDVVAPGPGHSAADRSMSVRPDEGAPDGFLVHSFAGDDAIECKEYVTEKLGLTPKSKSGGTGGGRARKPIASTSITAKTARRISGSKVSRRRWQEAISAVALGGQRLG